MHTPDVLWIGTYPVAGQGAPAGMGEGVWRVELDPESGRLGASRQVVETPAPSFLAHGVDADTVFAVNETPEGGLTTLRLTAEGAEIVAQAPTGGADPCHLWVDRMGRFVVAANYTGGSLGVVRLDRRGGLELSQVVPLEGSGPHAARQAWPHPHFVMSAPGDRHLLVVDLGSDVIWRLEPDATTGCLVRDGVAARLPAGCGPRHAAWSDDGRWMYVIGELDAQVYTIAWDGDGGEGCIVASVPAWSDLGGGLDLAHITLDGHEVLVGARGADLMVRHNVLPGRGTESVAGYRLPGSTPRHHAVCGAWMVVALQGSNQVCVLDRSNGAVVDVLPLPSPACILPALS